MTIKLTKDEIADLRLELKKPPAERWKDCPLTHAPCNTICNAWFPKIIEPNTCPHACENPIYTPLAITRKVKKHLREQGVKI